MYYLLIKIAKCISPCSPRLQLSAVLSLAPSSPPIPSAHSRARWEGRGLCNQIGWGSHPDLELPRPHL